jgi:trimeric autotransporter adhesin
MTTINEPSGSVAALTVFDDGHGPALYAGGYFTFAGGVPVNQIAKWNGAQWSALGAGTNSAVFALAVFDDGAGPALYAGGYFSTAGGVDARGIAKWDGTQWSALGSGMGIGFVNALTVFDDGGGTGPALYAAGEFTVAGGVAAYNIAKWDGAQWSALGSGMGGGGWVKALAVLDDGRGPALYAAAPSAPPGACQPQVLPSGTARNGHRWEAESTMRSMR